MAEHDPHSGFEVPEVCSRGFEKVDRLVEAVTGLKTVVEEHTRLLTGPNGHNKRLRVIEAEVQSAEAQVKVLKWLLATVVTLAGLGVALARIL